MSESTQSQGSPQKETPKNSNPRDETQKIISEFSELFGAATQKWKNNLSDLAVITLVMLLIGLIPFANIAFLAGYLRALLKAARGEKPVVRDLFTAWDCFAPMLVYVVIVVVVMLGVHFIPIFGTIINILITIVITPGLYAIADQKMEALDAFKWSYTVVKRNTVGWILAILIGGMLSSIGALAIFIGLILTMPWGYMIIALQYERDKFLTLPQRV